MKHVYDDGGRGRYFAAKKVGDCVVRAVAIATRMDYKRVYDEITCIVGYTPRNGVRKADTRKIMAHFGGRWHPTMTIGSGCKTHLKDGEIPKNGNIVCKLSKHVVAVIDGAIHDTYDSSRNGTRCVYGYWVFDKTSK